MTQVPITSSNIETASYTVIFDEINKRSNIPDPREPAGNGTRVFVYDADPFPLSLNFNDVPYIIVEMPTYEQVRESLDANKRGYRFRSRITIRTSRRGASRVGAIDQGRTDMMNITDDLNKTFNSQLVREALRQYGFTNFRLTKISTNMYPVDQNYVYESVYELSYDASFMVVYP